MTRFGNSWTCPHCGHVYEGPHGPTILDEDGKPDWTPGTGLVFQCAACGGVLCLSCSKSRESLCDVCQGAKDTKRLDALERLLAPSLASKVVMTRTKPTEVLASSIYLYIDNTGGHTVRKALDLCIAAQAWEAR